MTKLALNETKPLITFELKGLSNVFKITETYCCHHFITASLYKKIFMINEYVYSIDQLTYTQRRGHIVNVINSLTEPFSLRKAIHRKKISFRELNHMKNNLYKMVLYRLLVTCKHGWYAVKSFLYQSY